MSSLRYFDVQCLLLNEHSLPSPITMTFLHCKYSIFLPPFSFYMYSTLSVIKFLSFCSKVFLLSSRLCKGRTMTTKVTSRKVSEVLRTQRRKKYLQQTAEENCQEKETVKFLVFQEKVEISFKERDRKRETTSKVTGKGGKLH